MLEVYDGMMEALEVYDGMMEALEVYDGMILNVFSRCGGVYFLTDERTDVLHARITV